MDNKKSSAAAALSAAAEEDRSEVKNMISPMSTSCAPSNSNRKRPFDALEEGSGRNDTAAATACNMSITETNEPSSSIEALLKHMQQKMNDMQTEIDTTKAENIELKSKYYELEIKVDEITSLKDEYNEGSYDNKRNIYDMQIEIDKLTKRNQELEYSVKDLRLKNEYKEWSHMAEDIPASYWIERGFSEEYAECMAEFLGRIKEYTHQLRRGEQIESIDLVFTNYHILHDDILLPHWKEVADALKQYQKFNHRKDHGINLFAIDNVQLQQEVMDMLAPVLQTLSIKGLLLGRNIGSDALSFSEGIMQSNPYLNQFSWRNNRIESVDDMKKLCKAIKKSNSVTSLALINCFDGNNLQMMQTILDASHQLGKLFLNNNGIGTVGASLIANWLLSNPPLKSLHLKNNDLNDTDATLLANSLQSNTHLRWIYLNNNDITSIGRRVLLESVFDVSTLNTCAASNHNCCIRGLNPDISKINKYDQSSANRENKIFTILSATDDDEFFNMNCLGDVSYQLIPRVLRLAQTFTVATPELSEAYFEQTGQTSADWDKLDEDSVPITSMFELLRGWAVPSLSA